VEPGLPLPTDAELQILRVLWGKGASTVREVHEVLNFERPNAARRQSLRGYTTTLKLLQIMHDKGLVKRDDSRRTHVYAAAQAPERTQRSLVSDLLERAFGGSAGKLVLHALSEKPASSDELREIRRLLDIQESAR
jgi:BlaI family penicillinase repressor